MFGDDYNDIWKMESQIERYSNKFDIDPDSVELILLYELEHSVKDEYDMRSVRENEHIWNKKSSDYSIIIYIYESSAWICSYCVSNEQSMYTVHHYLRDKKDVGKIHKSIIEEGTSGLIQDYADDSILAEFTLRPEYEYKTYNILFGDKNDLLSNII